MCIGLLLGCGGNGGNQPAPEANGPEEVSDDDAGGGGAAVPAGGEGEITILSWGFANNEHTEQLLADWDEMFDFTIHREAAPGYADTVQMLTIMLASGDDSYDVMFIDEIMQLSFTRAGFLAPLCDVISDDQLDGFLPDYIDMFMRYEGRLYAVPNYIGIIGFFVNMRMLDEVGLSIPTNEQELIEAAVALTDPSINQFGMVLSLDRASHLQDNMNMFSLLFDGDYYDFTNPGTQRALQFLYDLINTYAVVSRDSLGYDLSAQQQVFVDELSGLAFNWGFVQAMEEAGKFGADYLTWAPMPTFETNRTPYASWMWVVNGFSENLDAAKQFVAAKTDPQVNLNTRFALGGGIPANTLAWGDPILEAEVPNILNMFRSYNDAGSLTARTLTTRHSEYMDTVMGTVQRFLLGEITLEETVELGQAQIDTLLEGAAD